jgi:hypothetical protein
MGNREKNVRTSSAADGVRTVAELLTLVGAVVSLGLMLWVGHRNSSVVLIAIFIVWVTSPFVMLLWAHRAAKGWPPAREELVRRVAISVSLGSVFVYAATAFLMHLAKPAGPFLFVPFASWCIIALFLGRRITATRKQAGK